MSEDESRRYCEAVFAPDLGGHPLLTNRSLWITFKVLTNRRWSQGNIVLVGDALRTVHFSIGSGTRNALEDAIALFRAFEPHCADVPAALRNDPQLTAKTFQCRSFGGRGGAQIPGWRRTIRDDVGDPAHGKLAMRQAITVSCNAYFAQLGVFAVGPDALRDTLHLLELPDADPVELKAMLPFAAYGQGPILATPFKLARVAATIADGGLAPRGHWLLENAGEQTPAAIVPPATAAFLADAMRSVVANGTARRAMKGARVSIAGKTGTAEPGGGKPDHAWFAGFAPYDSEPGGRVAFAVIVEHGGYGGSLAAPIAKEIVEAAADLGVIAEVAPHPGPEPLPRGKP
jgi:hypothetical protein